MGIKHGAPLMLASCGGVLINCSSPAGNLAFPPPVVIYAASKAAVTALTRSFAQILEGKGISVFAVCPFATDTPMLHNSPLSKEEFAAWNPSGKIVRPEDVAALVLALAEGSSEFAHGDIIFVDDGMTMKLSPPTATGMPAF